VFLWREHHRAIFAEIWQFIDNNSSTAKASLSPILPPSEIAVTASQSAEYESLSQNFNAHGTYVPHACFSFQAKRWVAHAFHTPYLATASFDTANVVRIYDIARGELYQIIDLDPTLSSLAGQLSTLLDLELSDKYLCACFDTAVVFVRLCCRSESNIKDGIHTSQCDAVCFVDEWHPFEEKYYLPQAEREPGHASAISRTDGVHVSETDYVALAVLPGVSVLEEHTVVTLPDDCEPQDALLGSSQTNTPCFISGAQIVFVAPYHPKEQTQTHTRCSKIFSKRTARRYRERFQLPLLLSRFRQNVRRRLCGAGDCTKGGVRCADQRYRLGGTGPRVCVQRRASLWYIIPAEWY
jgi:hypothetical protein